jgi:hypothetical protein
MRYRSTFARLAEKLLDEAIVDPGNPELHLDTAEMHVDTSKVIEAVRVLDKSLEELPLYQIPADLSTLQHVSAYYRAGEFEKGNNLARHIIKEQLQELKYYSSLSSRQRMSVRRDENASKTFINILLEEAARVNQEAFIKEVYQFLEETLNPSSQNRVEASLPDSTEKLPE